MTTDIMLMQFSLGSGPSPLHFRAKRTPTQQGIEWKEQRKHQYNTWRKANKRPIEVHQVSEGFDLAKDSRISKPAWMGLKAPKDARDVIYKAIVDPSPTAAHSIFKGITKIPYVAWVGAILLLNAPLILAPQAPCSCRMWHRPKNVLVPLRTHP